jgi:hypothetical protein
MPLPCKQSQGKMSYSQVQQYSLSAEDDLVDKNYVPVNTNYFPRWTLLSRGKKKVRAGK